MKLSPNSTRMRPILFAAFILCYSFVYAQNDNEGVKRTITTFFNGMHSNDTIAIKNSLDSACFLYSIMQKKDGSTVLEEEKTSSFFEQVAQLKGQKLEEKLLSYDIKIDGAMAIAWTPYKFYYNDTLSHCGVNVFTLIKRNGEWKIMGITDTRRKQGCDAVH